MAFFVKLENIELELETWKHSQGKVQCLFLQKICNS